MRATWILGVALMLPAGPAWAETSLTLGYQPTLDVMPAFVAKQEGFFARHGLDVTMVAGNGAIQISGVVAKSLQIGNPTVPQVLQAVDSGLDLVIVAGANVMSLQAAEFALVVRTGQTLREPKDFIGHKVAVNTVGSFLHVLFVQWLKNHEVDPQQVTFVEVPFPQMSDVLRQGTVDAVISVEPFVSRMVAAKAGSAEDEFARDFPAGMPVAVYAAERDWAGAHREALEGFRAALQDGLALMQAHPDQGRADTLKFLKMPPEVMASMTLPALQVAVPAAGIEQWIAILRTQNLINGNPDAAQLIVK